MLPGGTFSNRITKMHKNTRQRKTTPTASAEQVSSVNSYCLSGRCTQPRFARIIANSSSISAGRIESTRLTSPSGLTKKWSSEKIQPAGQSPHALRKTAYHFPSDHSISISGLSHITISGLAEMTTAAAPSVEVRVSTLAGFRNRVTHYVEFPENLIDSAVPSKVLLLEAFA